LAATVLSTTVRIATMDVTRTTTATPTKMMTRLRKATQAGRGLRHDQMNVMNVTEVVVVAMMMIMVLVAGPLV
jgi:hypothetical protein